MTKAAGEERHQIMMITERDRISNQHIRKIKVVKYKQLSNPVTMIDTVWSGDQFMKYVTTQKQINFMSMCVCP